MSTEFIKMVADFSERRFLRTFQALTEDKTPCAIFFAPVVPANARQIADTFKNVGINLSHVCVLVEEYKKFFKPADDETLIALEELPTLPEKPKYVFVLDRWFGEMFMDYFENCGTKMFFLPDVAAAEAQYNLYMKHLPELYAVHEMLADDESKKFFRAAITGRITRLMQDFIFSDECEYFLNGFLPTAGDIAIDGGSYNGDTAADFVRQGAKVYSFEMDANHYKNCIEPAEKFGFTIENLGLSNQQGKARYISNGTGSRKIEDGSTRGYVGEFIDLDSYVDEKNLPRVDYIKLDIEGSELDALYGATKTITRWKPKMAICIYHKPEDLWTLPIYIKRLRGDYEFQFRHQRCDRRKEVNTSSHVAMMKYFGVNYRTPSEYEMILYCR